MLDKHDGVFIMVENSKKVATGVIANEGEARSGLTPEIAAFASCRLAMTRLDGGWANPLCTEA
jgi:hypothetical protein